MILTPYDFEQDKSIADIFYKLQNMALNAIKSGDTRLEYVKTPVVKNFPKNEGIHCIVQEILALDELSTQEIANILLKYIDFVKYHKIEIIKEYDKKSSLALEGKLPKFSTDRMKIQSYIGCNHFQIINSETLTREKEGIYTENIDFTNALDSNVASNFMKYYTNADEQYRDLYEMIISNEFNLDILPYVFEIAMNGIKKYGTNYKLNKKNKNDDQKKFFENLSILHKHNLFQDKLEKTFMNNLVKSHNLIIEQIALLYYSAYIFTIILMEAKFLFKDSKKKIKHHVFSELRTTGIPIESRYRSILYLFTEKPGHKFFEKIVNINNTEKYFNNIDNTARDIALSTLDKYIYLNQTGKKKLIFPFLASDDEGFVKMLDDTKPDLLFGYSGKIMHMYKTINLDIKKNYYDLFATTNDAEIYQFKEKPLKELIVVAKSKEANFKKLISDI